MKTQIIIVLLMTNIGLSGYSQDSITSNGNFVNGLKEGIWEFYENDTLFSISSFKRDTLHGIRIYLFSSGGISNVENYSMGRLNGIRRGYTKSGKLLYHEFYKNNIPIGTQIEYSNHDFDTLKVEYYDSIGRLIKVDDRIEIIDFPILE